MRRTARSILPDGTGERGGCGMLLLTRSGLWPTRTYPDRCNTASPMAIFLAVGTPASPSRQFPDGSTVGTSDGSTSVGDTVGTGTGIGRVTVTGWPATLNTCINAPS